MPPSILVLEDNAASRFVIREVLERAGYSCVEAETSGEAMASMREHAADLLLTDVKLGSESGVEAARGVGRLAPQIPVLFISGYPLEQLLARGHLRREDLDPGCASFLQKPFVPDALLRAVKGLLEKTTAASDGGSG